MEYQGAFPIFDPSGIRTYPIRERRNKCSVRDFIDLDAAGPEADASPEVQAVAQAMAEANRRGLPVIAFTGAHPIKAGLSPIYLDWLRRGAVSLIATNGAGGIHDFEYAMLGETSEDVRGALPRGEFGMAFETGAFINYALAEGEARRIGYGESLGRFIADAAFRAAVLERVEAAGGRLPEHLWPVEGLPHPQASIAAVALRQGIPFTVHASMGTDILDQHPSFDGRAKGATSGRDFLIYTRVVADLAQGGVVLNLGSAVTGPEVLLKAISMAANSGRVPRGIVCADFDIRPPSPDAQARDDRNYHYYFRDQKSVATRVPQVFEGQGHYVQGDMRETLPALYRAWRRAIED